jgi:hypothetical protein
LPRCVTHRGAAANSPQQKATALPPSRTTPGRRLKNQDIGVLSFMVERLDADLLLRRLERANVVRGRLPRLPGALRVRGSEGEVYLHREHHHLRLSM